MSGEVTHLTPTLSFQEREQRVTPRIEAINRTMSLYGPS
jgi:hypothetical protein